MKTEADFEKTFVTAVDNILNQIFGHSAALIIYNHLQKNTSLSPEDIPRRLETFAKGLESFLNSGAYVIEGIILSHLYSNYGFQFERMEEGHSFVDYVVRLKNMVDQKVKT